VQEKDRGRHSPLPLPAMRNKVLARHDSEREHAMSQPAFAALAPLPFELVLDDGEPLEFEWHTLEYPLLRSLIGQAMAEQGRTDFYVGGNMFVYFSLQQAREVFEEERTKTTEKRAFRGPDVFWVGGVDPNRDRQAWIAWEEGGRLPDVIVELLSPSTAEKDRTKKRDLYAQVFRTAEYFLYDPLTRQLDGLRLAGSAYWPIRPDADGRLWSEQLGVFFGPWHGTIEGRERDWVRLFRPDGTLVPTAEEQAEAERQRAEAERQQAEAERQRAEAERQRADAEWRRAEAAEAELARLRVLLDERSRG
jgi:Uma2 family endonuclease